YDAQPNDPLKAETAELWAERTANILTGEEMNATVFARRLPNDGQDSKILERDAFVDILNQKIGQTGNRITSTTNTKSDHFTRSHACEIIYEVLDNNRPI